MPPHERRARWLRSLASALAALAVLSGMSAPPASAVLVDVTRNPVFIPRDFCTERLFEHPDRFRFGCGGCGVTFTSVRWQTWRRSIARGTATYRNTVPRRGESCAQATRRTRSTRVRVRLAGRRVCDGVVRYTEVLVSRDGRTILNDRRALRCSGPRR